MVDSWSFITYLDGGFQIFMVFDSFFVICIFEKPVFSLICYRSDLAETVLPSRLSLGF